MNLTINNKLLEKLPNFTVIAYTICFNNSYNVLDKSINVTNIINELNNTLHNIYNYDEITLIPKLKETRDMYKTLGKDPSHTRPACEALLRRIINKKGLYRLGDVIDLGNILSIKSLRSVCVVDSDKLEGNIEITLGTNNDSFNGINRDIINMNNMIIYKDELGAFGSPTSDTDRTKVTINTKNILVMIICPSTNNLIDDEKLLVDLYKNNTNYISMNKIY